MLRRVTSAPVAALGAPCCAPRARDAAAAPSAAPSPPPPPLLLLLLGSPPLLPPPWGPGGTAGRAS